MTKLSVNINKIATLRNSRGEDNPNVVKVALDCERFERKVLRCIRVPTNATYAIRMCMI